MPYNLVAHSFHTRKLCSRLSSTEVHFWRKTAILRFWAPLCGLWVTCAIHLRLIGKRVVDFLLVMIELISLGITAEALWTNIDWKSVFLKEGVSFIPNFKYTNHSSCQITRWNRWKCLLYGVRILAEFSFVLAQFTHLTDRQTSGQKARG